MTTEPLSQPSQPDAPAEAMLPSMAPPDVSPPPPGINPAAPPPPPPGAGGGAKPGLWSSILVGALSGLAGVNNVKGRGGFGSGAGAGAENELRQQQVQVENKQQQQQINQRQQQLQFESVRAADSHIAALDQHKNSQQLSQNLQLDYNMKSAQYAAFLMNEFAIPPDVKGNDSHNEATAGLTTLANNNGGSIPPVSVVNQPAPDGEHGTLNVYSPSQQKFLQNMSGYRNLINTARAVQGMPAIDDASFNTMGFKGARDQALGAIEFLKPTPTFSLDKNSPNYLQTVLAQKQQQLQQYQDHKDASGKPDADPSVVKQLQNGVDYLQKSWDSTNAGADKAAADTIKATGPAKAEAEKQAAVAKESTPGGQATVAKNQAQAEQAQTQATLNKEALGRTDDFGNKIGGPGENPKAIQDKQKVFNAKYVEPLAPLVKSDMEFNRILSAGDKMTPADKVTGLLQAVGISFDPLKGKGARLNNDIIQEHAGARDIYQGALQKIDSLRPGGGGPITPKQVQDYATIARGVIHDAYVYSAHEAQRQNLPVDFLPKASKPNEVAPDDVLRIYFDAANGDHPKALAALSKAGFK